MANAPPSSFRIAQQSLELAPRAEAVRNAYIDDVGDIIIVKTPEETPDSEKKDASKEIERARDKGDIMDSVAMGDAPYIGFPEYVKAPIMIVDEISFKAAEVFWEAIKAKYSKDSKKAIPVLSEQPES